ncbi:MAG TPA: hypothetical protein VEZ14_15080 [Dehalococcoidia bacterium]|nr:hypothetical protein [Dehalococcoidia bacterium]
MGNAVLLGAVAAVMLLAIGSLLAGIALAILNGESGFAGTAWVAVSVAGLPAMALSFLYIVGFPIVLFIFWSAAFAFRWRHLDTMLPSIWGLTATSYILIPALTNGSDSGNPVAAALMAVSAVCAIFAVAKLGRAFGRETIWRSRPVAATPTPPR